MSAQEVQTVGDLVDRLPPIKSAAVQAIEPVSNSDVLMRIIERAASSSDFDIEKLEKLLDVKERWEANEARKAYISALAAFKADPPTIIKNKHVGFNTRDGDKTEYDHATLDQVCNAIAPALSKQGLSHRWNIEQGEGMIRVTCILTHVMGHSEKVMLAGGADQSGKKNAIQAVASTVTYLQRYTLLAATGLAARDQDNDGTGGDDETISVEQKETLIALIQETGADVKAFLKYIKVGSLDEILAVNFDGAKAALEKKRGAQK